MAGENRFSAPQSLLVASFAWLLCYTVLFGVILNPLNLSISTNQEHLIVAIFLVLGLVSLSLALLLGIRQLQSSWRDARLGSHLSSMPANMAEADEQQP